MRKQYQCMHGLVSKYRLLGEDKFLQPIDGVIYWYLGNLPTRQTGWTDDLPKAVVIDAFERVFDTWGEALYFLDFKQTDDKELAHIQFWFGSEQHLHLGGCPFEFDGQNGVLAHAFPRGSGGLSGQHAYRQSSIHFDEAENWTVSSKASAEEGIDLFQVALHEVGHVLGLGHSEIEAAIMFAYYDGKKTALHADDVAGVRELYKEFEPKYKWWFWLKKLVFLWKK